MLGAEPAQPTQAACCRQVKGKPIEVTTVAAFARNAADAAKLDGGQQRDGKHKQRNQCGARASETASEGGLWEGEAAFHDLTFVLHIHSGATAR
ncbi:hypothetical protein [Cupriavidus basilensis]